VNTFACRTCRRVWGLSSATGPGDAERCVWCGGALAPVDLAGSDFAHPPDRRAAPGVDARRAAQLLRDWVREVPHPGPELLGAADELRLAWVPRWLVDVDVDAVVEARTGVDEVVDAPIEIWSAGAWAWREAPAVRVRWTRVAGRVARRYAQLPVDALAAAPIADLGGGEGAELALPTGQEQPWLLPSRSPREQAPAAEAALRAAIAADCVRALGARHVDDVHVARVDASAPRWSLLVVPAWVTHYRDDDGAVRTLAVNGVTGACSGPRLGSRAVASAFAARQTTTGLAVVAFAGFLALVGVIFWLLLPMSAVVGLLGLRAVLSARSAGPAVASWNRVQTLESGRLREGGRGL
jgi:hypothetical protein